VAAVSEAISPPPADVIYMDRVRFNGFSWIAPCGTPLASPYWTNLGFTGDTSDARQQELAATLVGGTPVLFRDRT